MASKGVNRYSTTPGDNVVANTGINMVGSMAANLFDDGVRAFMADVKAFVNILGGVGVSAGTQPAYTLDLTQAAIGYATAPTAYATGDVVGFTAHADATGDATLNVNGVGAKKWMAPDGLAQAGVGYIKSGYRYVLIYDATADGSNGAWIMLKRSSPYFSEQATFDTGGAGPVNVSRLGSTGAVGIDFINDDGSVRIAGKPSGADQGDFSHAGSDGDVSLGATTRFGPGYFTNVNAQISSSSETSGTLTAASANDHIDLAGNITIDNGVFSAGDRISLYAGSSARTITEDTGMTLYLSGTSTTGNRTLLARGVATIYFVSSSEAVISGDVT